MISVRKLDTNNMTIVAWNMFYYLRGKRNLCPSCPMAEKHRKVHFLDQRTHSIWTKCRESMILPQIICFNSAAPVLRLVDFLPPPPNEYSQYFSPTQTGRSRLAGAVCLSPCVITNLVPQLNHSCHSCLLSSHAHPPLISFECLMNSVPLSYTLLHSFGGMSKFICARLWCRQRLYQ
jgi:hypothetical protein